MHPFFSSPLFFYHRSTTLAHDVEMLQTDVMRFFAILCLCLMAIFALVKALPIAPATDQPAMAEPHHLQTAAASLQEEISALKKKLAKTQSQLTAATAAVETSAVQAAEAAAIEQQTLSRLSEARTELAMVSQTLKETRDEIKAREAMLAQLVQDIRDKRQVRSALKTQIENETRNLNEIKAALDQAAARLNRTLQRKQQPPVKKPPAPAPMPAKPAKKGFTLRFASDMALQTLILHEKVYFFALAGRKAWQLRLAKGQPVYMAVKMPSKIYEMETSTVPADYSAVFRRQVAAFGRGTVTWGVTLPEQTTAAINQLIKEREGGDLLIMADGKVLLN